MPLTQQAEITRAGDLYEDFTGHKADIIKKITVEHPRTALQFGMCDGIMYETVRDGKKEHYIHKFKKSARPMIGASFDGKKILLIGGNYQFTDAGITDN